MHHILQWAETMRRIYGSLTGIGDAPTLRAMLGFCDSEIEEFAAMMRAMECYPPTQQEAVLSAWPDIGAIREVRAEIAGWFEARRVAT